jgi:hypothetical protein
MPRQKKIKSLQVEGNSEVTMSGAQVLESLETELDRARQELEKTKQEIEEKKSQIKTMSSREVTEDEMIIVKKQVNMTSARAALKEKIEKQKAYDNVKVTGRFLNLRVKGQSIKIPYHKYEDDPVVLHELHDGQVYTIPRGFADQLNGGTENDPFHYVPKYLKREEPMDPNRPMSQISNVDTSNKKYAFVPVNF